MLEGGGDPPIRGLEARAEVRRRLDGDARGGVHLPHDGLPPGVLDGDTSAEQHAERLGFLTPPESLLAGTGARLVRAWVVDSGERVVF